MKFQLDYLAARLNERYDHIRFREECESPVFNRDTGDILNSNIRKDQYGLDVHGRQVTARCYKGGQFPFAGIVNREQLKVTRVDIACDVSSKDMGEDYNAIQHGQFLKRKIQNFYSEVHRKVLYSYFESITPSGGLAITHIFGARSSDKQIRIYTKSTDTEQVLRIEFQLRKELSRSAWTIISQNVFDQQALSECFSAIEVKLLRQNLLNLGLANPKIDLAREVETEASNREQWVLTQVLAACIKEFNDNRNNLPEKLLKAFNAHYVQLAQKDSDYLNGTIL